MPPIIRNHLIIENRTEVLPYTSNQLGRSPVILRLGLEKTPHGNDIKQQFETAVSDFSDEDDPEFVYLDFKSPIDFLIDIQKLDKSNLRLANYRVIEVTDQSNLTHKIVEATVGLNRRAISAFLKKVDQYLNKLTKGGNPANQILISNIEEIKASTLRSFWQEPELPFPEENANVWWEVWLSRNPLEEVDDPLHDIRQGLTENNVQIGQRVLKFPEHYIVLLRGTANQLSDSILSTDRLAEIRSPKETAEFFMYLDREDQNNWIQELLARVQSNQEGSGVSVCLLDTGVNRTNPLLINYIPAAHLDSINPAWGNDDSHIRGHGTPMAGLSLFGDLVDAFDSNDPVQINHHIESVKLIHPAQPHDPELYGAVTQEAVNRAIVLNPEFRRMICMAITSNRIEYKGRPSSWSSAVDQTIFGTIDALNSRQLFFVSSGNLSLDGRINYPLSNDDCSIEDPAQAFNVITVGSYTLKDQIDLVQFVGAELLAQRGGMSPCNTTSISWDNEWCKKPDIVMEGGNQAIHNGGTIDPDSLQLLTTSKGGIGRPWLTTFNCWIWCPQYEVSQVYIKQFVIVYH